MNQYKCWARCFPVWLAGRSRIKLQGLSQKYPTCLDFSALVWFVVFLLVAAIKVIPFWWNNAFLSVFPHPEAVLELVFEIAFSAPDELASTVSLSSNWCLWSTISNVRNCQKSQRAMSGLYAGCTRFAEWAGALSWWRNQLSLDQKLVAVFF